MKNVIFALLLFTSLLSAQVAAVDSCAGTIAGDSVSIRDLVQQQIDKALEKQSIQAAPPVSEAGINVIPKTVKIAPASNPLISIVKSLPVHIMAFVSASFLVILTVLIRRAIMTVKKRSSRRLKNKISSLREEKVFVKENPRLKGERVKLRNHKSIYNVSEKHISKLARELKIAKGELLLASRIKQYETGKI